MKLELLFTLLLFGGLMVLLPAALMAAGCLHYSLEVHEKYVTDRVYGACKPIAVTSSGLGRFIDRQIGTLRARDEGINRRLKEFSVLKLKFHLIL